MGRIITVVAVWAHVVVVVRPEVMWRVAMVGRVTVMIAVVGSVMPDVSVVRAVRVAYAYSVNSHL